MVLIKCPDCEGKFRWDMKALGWPRNCPICQAFVGSDRADDDIVMPSIKTMRTKVIDKTYTDMEKGSEQRMHLAAEMTGAPASEFSGLKITDLNDRRDAEIAAKEPVAAMQRLGIRDSNSLFQQNGAEWKGAVKQGPYPNAGINAHTSLQRAFGR